MLTTDWIQVTHTRYCHVVYMHVQIIGERRQLDIVKALIKGSSSEEYNGKSLVRFMEDVCKTYEVLCTGLIKNEFGLCLTYSDIDLVYIASKLKEHHEEHMAEYPRYPVPI